ncbi:hypothetical protein TCA2_4466 [Paenibacillus sp. TCA20]|uniref:hypothetical protein n=1 Tax=Paenibacillus sp. TCA20 TaxID=1499968 RepID=UPI0004DAB66F|nr:hypothetical protein [Paenibacillus sp. TCA20]GAK41974.1 hypothetical protein TCA2_4466 [Paenibacillus sp. TCA20]
MLINIVNKIVNAGTLNAITEAVKPLAPMQRYEALRAASEELSDQVEAQIASKSTLLAMWTMSKLAIIDDLALQEERRAHNVLHYDRIKEEVAL